MRKSQTGGIGSSTPVTLLSVSPDADDHTVLAAIFDRSEYSVRSCATVKSAIAALSQAQIPIVVTERDLMVGSWRDILEHIFLFPDRPTLIVTSRLADEYLWAEALNLGAYDVLAKPFDASEVMRVVASAWRHWTDLRRRIQVRNQQPRVATTAV